MSEPKGTRTKSTNAAVSTDHAPRDESEPACLARLREGEDLPADITALARFAEGRRDWLQAFDYWQLCRVKFPEHPSVFSWRVSAGAALIERGRLDDAETFHRALVKDNPKRPAGLIGLARVAQRRGAWSNAVEFWNECLERFPNAAGVRRPRALALEKAAEWQAAFEAWNELVARSGPDRDLLVGRARCYANLVGPTVEADHAVAEVLDKFPDDLAMRKLHAAIASRRGDIQIALARYMRCIELDRGNIDFYTAAMEMIFPTRDFDTAELLIAMAPAELAASSLFRCQILLDYHRMCGNISGGLAIIDLVSDAEDIDLSSFKAINRFLLYAVNYERLLSLSKRMLTRFSGDLAVIRIYLVALYHARGQAAFEAEKTHMLGPLEEADAARVLRGFVASWLTAAEARKVIDDAFARDRSGDLALAEVMNLGLGGDSETLTYLAERITARGRDRDRIFTTSLLATVQDRQRIEYANLGGTRWRDFAAFSVSVRQDLVSALNDNAHSGARRSRAAQIAGTLEVLSRRCHRALNLSAECYDDAASFAAWLAGRIARCEATSIIRIGDGEGTFLPYGVTDNDFQVPDQRYMQQIWWGEALISGPAAETTMRNFAAAISRADAVGAPQIKRIFVDFQGQFGNPGQRGLESAVKFIDELNDQTLSSKVLTSCHIHTDLYTWDLYRQIFQPLTSVSVISCHDLARPLAERFGLAVRTSFPIPPEFRYARMFAAADIPAYETFYPDIFNQTLHAVDPQPGEVFLVAAGFLGKLLCDRIRERGGIALDIGCVADLWMGYRTRRQSAGAPDFDVSSSLIEGQPFADSFDPKSLSPAGPCRSDSTRRRNLAGRFDSLFETDRVAPDRRYAVRIIGHPRCGSAYITQILNRLGLEIGHERPAGHGICSWVHAVDDLNPAVDAIYASPAAFDTTLAYVRDPQVAIPSIMLENCRGKSFAFRRFHIGRQLGIDIAARRDPLERAVASYLAWLQIVTRQSPLLTLRVEHLLEDLAAHEAVLAQVGLHLNWANRHAAETIARDANSSSMKFTAAKPIITADRYLALPTDLLEPLSAFCACYGYTAPSVVQNNV